ncbi:MAG: hypothetical protein ACI9SD_000144 [Pseudohongiellaceae bacterium]|jgi:hypothetical protein
MASVKFEESLKDKLEKRTLQPSSDAWDKLSTDLDASNKNSKRGFLFYIGIAASIIGIIFVTNIMFNASENQLVEPTVVETSIKASQIKVEANDSNEAFKKEVVAEISEENKKQKQIKPSIKDEPKLATISNQSTNNKTETKIEKSIKEKLIKLNETKQAVAIINSNTNKLEQTAVSTLTFEEVKAVEVVNQIKNLTIKNGAITDAEIKNLLKQAERAILRERIYNKTSRTVDADALLQDVEDDLEQSFRTRVFEGLKSGYKSVITAVAERNN